MPGKDLTCLAAAPDGDRIYASMWSSADPPDTELTTVDARSGDELGRVSMDGVEFVVGVVNKGEQ